MFKRFAFLLLAWCPLYAFAQKDNDTVQHVDLDSITVSAPAGPAPYRAATPLAWDITHTRIALSFNEPNRTASVREWIKLHPYYYPTDTVVLDAKSMQFDSVSMISKNSSKALTYRYANDQLTIRFPRPVAASDSIELYLRYTAMPYENKTGGSAAIKSDRGLYFINTNHKAPYKPAQIWTQGETESNSHWMAIIDKPNSRFTLQVEITAPDSLVTLSNGALVKQQKQPGGLRTDVWKMDKPIQAYAAMMAIGKFAIIKDTWNGKEVSYYVEPEYAAYARSMFRHTPEMLTFFSKATGVPYPWNKYSQVVVRDYVSGAMENTSASLFGEFMYETPRETDDAMGEGTNHEDIVSHELFHQWFGDYVSCESWSNLTLSESFANYGEQLWRNYKYGKVNADRLAWSDLNIYLLSSRAHDPQLVRFHYDDKEEMFDAISYHKGGAILHYLHTLLGDDAFERSMKLYLTRHAFGTAEAHDWRLAIEEVTGQDWNWFFNEWYYHEGHPTLKVEYKYDDNAQQLTVDVTQTQDDSTIIWTLPLKTAILYGRDRELADWRIDRKSHTFRYPYKQGKRPVIVPDYEHVLVGEIRENKEPAEWLAQLQFTGDYVSKRLAVHGAAKKMSDSSSQALLDFALKDSIAAVREYAVDEIGSAISDKYRKRWTSAIIAATTDADHLVRASAFDVLGKWKIADARAKMIESVSDSSYVVAGAALRALDKIDKDTAYVIARRILTTSHPHGRLESAIWPIIASKGAASDIAFFTASAPRAFGGKRLAFATPLSTWMSKTDADDAYQKAVDLYADLVIYETMSSTRSAIGGSIFQAAAAQKSRLKEDDKNTIVSANARLAMLKAAAQHIIAAEQEEEVKKKFEKMYTDNFEGE